MANVINKGEKPKKIKINRTNTTVELKIGRSSISAKLSARPSKSVSRAKSYKKPLVNVLGLSDFKINKII